MPLPFKRRFFLAVAAMWVVHTWGHQAAADITFAPGPNGALAAWLVAGTVGRNVEASISTLQPRAGSRVPAGPTWRIATAAAESLDLQALFKTKTNDAYALAATTLLAAEPWSGYLVLGGDDGVSVYLDGQRIYTRDAPRLAYPDDQLVALELPAGHHALVLLLHQHGGPWELHTRFTNRDFTPARGLQFGIATDTTGGELARSMAALSLDRGLGADGHRPRLHVSFPGGLPLDAPRDVRATAWVMGQRETPKFAVRAGWVPLPSSGPAQPWEVALPWITNDELAAVDRGQPLIIEGAVGGASKTFELRSHPSLRAAVACTEKMRGELAPYRSDGDNSFLDATLEYEHQRMREYADRGDADLPAQKDEAQQVLAVCSLLEQKQDPLRKLAGAHRWAYRSRLDGQPSPFALYVPRSFVANPNAAAKFPLVIALHGLNGRPLSMLQWAFGHDDPTRDSEWEDRHPGDLPDIEAFVLAPHAYGNSGYRDLGEADVLELIAWAKRSFPIDETRVSITGPSMGGTGTAALALHRADLFAGAAPLCGYHSYYLRHDIAGKPRRPWENDLMDQRSNSQWAENGKYVPFWIVHGTQDRPVRNSGILIERYERLGYSLVQEHPEAGHNVWQQTYESLRGLRWLTKQQRPTHPKHVVWKTDDLRHNGYAWVHVTRLARSLAWGTVTADVMPSTSAGANGVRGVTQGIDGLAFDRTDAWPTPQGAVRIELDGQALHVAAGQPVTLTRTHGTWAVATQEAPPTLRKTAGLAGPLRDVFWEPVVVVVGTQDPALTPANEVVARWFARGRPGVDVHYPVVADTAFDPAQAAAHAWVLIGGASSNWITQRLDAALPIHVASAPPAVRADGQTFTGAELGAAFIYPNPQQPAHYVVVLAGADVAGTLRVMSLPELVPDYVIYDHKLASSRGQIVLAPGDIRKGGLFDEHWSFGK